MADQADVAATKLTRVEFSKRLIDTTQADLRVTHGVCYIRGALKTIRGGPTDLRKEVEIIAKVLRTRPGIKDVIIEATLRG